MLALEGAGALLLLLVLPLLLVAVRRRLLQRQGGTIELSLRLGRAGRLPGGAGWVLGIGRFEGDCLNWYRVFSVAPGPRRVLVRREIEVLHRRPPRGGEALALLEGAVVLECTTSAGPVELAMDAGAVTGFLAWLESGPPGSNLPG